tara:strand:+ start:1104 stop:1214 length:111 start_codon:yes stop_codon:yes gene_type:complete
VNGLVAIHKILYCAEGAPALKNTAGGAVYRPPENFF